uniref:Putative ATPase domain containing protein n=1 Tax=viral metagenome TaxID=1070528 RepID=A0A6M3K670_9ZZZZ
MTEQLPPFVTAIWGDEKTGKSSMSLTWPRPIVHLDVDVGGFNRAAWRIKDLTGIESHAYAPHVDVNKLLGAISTPTAGATPTVHFPKRIYGARETWQKIVTAYVEAVQQKEVQTIVIDTWTLTWNIAHNATLQELQEKQIKKAPNISEDALRESLMPKEYGTANSRMRGIIQTARGLSKNLVLILYPKDIYGVRATAQGTEEYRTGKQEADGFKETPKLVDIMIRTEVKSITKTVDGVVSTVAVPQAKITTCGMVGLGISAEGKYLLEPSYNGIVGLMSLLKGE